MVRNKSLLRYQKYPSPMNFSVLSDNLKRQKSEKKNSPFFNTDFHLLLFQLKLSQMMDFSRFANI